MLLLRLALRNILRHRIRSIVTLGTLAFGCSALIFAGGFFGDLYLKLEENEIETHNGHLQVTRLGFRASGGGDPYQYLVENPDDVIRRLEKIPGVLYCSPRLPFNGLISTGETTLPFGGLGVDPSKETMDRLSDVAAVARRARPQSGFLITEGDPMSLDDPEGVAVGAGLLEALGAAPGAELVVLSRTVDDSLSGTDVVVRGAMRAGIPEVDDFALKMPVATAQRLLRTDGVQILVIKLRETADTDRVKRAVNELIRREGWDLEVITWRDLSDFALKAVLLFERWYAVLNFIIGFVVVLNVYNTIAMSVIERTAEIGTARALGNRRSDVVRLFLLEGLVLGVVGGALGVATGALLTAAIGYIGIVMPPSPGFTLKWMSEPIVSPPILIKTFFMAVIAAVTAAVVPGIRASRLEIAQALRAAGK